MPRIYKTVSSNADATAQQVVNIAKTTGRTAKSTFSQRVWKADMVLAITGWDFVFDEGELNSLLAEHPNENPEELAKSLRTYPVLKTSLVNADNSQTEYKPLWLKTLVVSVDDAFGDEHFPEGTFNVLAREMFDAKPTDEETLKGILTGLNGKHVKCVRKTPIQRDYYGRTRTEKLCEFDIVE